MKTRNTRKNTRKNTRNRRNKKSKRYRIRGGAIVATRTLQRSSTGTRSGPGFDQGLKVGVDSLRARLAAKNAAEEKKKQEGIAKKKVSELIQTIDKNPTSFGKDCYRGLYELLPVDNYYKFFKKSGNIALLEKATNNTLSVPMLYGRNELNELKDYLKIIVLILNDVLYMFNITDETKTRIDDVYGKIKEISSPGYSIKNDALFFESLQVLILDYDNYINENRKIIDEYKKKDGTINLKGITKNLSLPNFPKDTFDDYFNQAATHYSVSNPLLSNQQPASNYSASQQQPTSQPATTSNNQQQATTNKPANNKSTSNQKQVSNQQQVNKSSNKPPGHLIKPKIPPTA